MRPREKKTGIVHSQAPCDLLAPPHPLRDDGLPYSRSLTPVPEISSQGQLQLSRVLIQPYKVEKI